MNPDSDPAVSAGERPKGKAAGHEKHPHGDEIGFELPEPAKLTGVRAVAVALVVLMVLAALFFVTFLPRRHAHTALVDSTRAAQDALRKVEVVAPKLSSSSDSITLPGSVKPLEETIIYSRANGYLRQWNVDMGDKVKEGQALADVETPDLDQEIVQARAQLAQADASTKQALANHDLAQSSLGRYQKLAAQGLATQQELDERSSQAQVQLANVDVARAMIGIQQANLARLGKLKSFATVTAPFSGTIISRMIDRGALVVAGNAGPLFKIAAMDPVRVYVDVPQDAAPSVKAEQPVSVTIREYPGRQFQGKVARTAGALDPASRTLSAEIRIPNPDGALLTGMYAEAALTLPVPHRTYELPATAVTTGEHGVRVQVVGAEGAVHLVPVAIERDLGATVRISSGLSGGERIVKLASSELTEGMRVQVAN